jgi:hypothetical protein
MSPFIDDMRKVFNTPGIPGIPNSTVGDLLGLGKYFGFDNPFGGDDDDDTNDKVKMIPYIIIGVGAVALIFVLKK